MRERELLIIEPGVRPWQKYLADIAKHRTLIWVFAKRELKAKYSQTLLGFAWTILQPLTGIVVFTFFFQRVLKLDVDVAYPLFLMPGLMSWYLFSQNLSNCSHSLVDSQLLISKMYFPRIILPFSKAVQGLVDFAAHGLLLLLLMVCYKVIPTSNLLLLPFFLMLNLMLGLGISLWLSALSLRWRDLLHIVPYLLHFSIWLTPVFYPTTILPTEYAWLLKLNPMCGIAEGYRYCVYGGQFSLIGYLPTFFLVVLLFLGGILCFRSVEHRIAEEI